MAGAYTRSGYEGGDTPGPTDPPPPADAVPRGARTVFGRDLHLQRSTLEAAVAEAAEAAADQPPPEDDDAPRARVPSHTGKSALPALAQLFWRWSAGRLRPASSYDFERDRETFVIPRDDYTRPVLLVVATAGLSFLLVLSLLRLRDHAGPPAAPPEAPAPIAAPVPAAAPAPAPAPVPPAAARPVAPVPVAAPAAPAPAAEPTVAPAARPTRRAPRAATRPAHPRQQPHDPDGVMPLSF
jgi:hypothetical protein